MSKTYQIRNNNQRIGKAKVHNSYRDLVLGGAVLTLVAALTVSTNIGKDDSNDKNVAQTSNTQNEQEYQRISPTYRVQYKVKFGDTLTGIVYGYETDPNKVDRIISEIVRINNLDNASSIRAGQEITLTGIKEEYLSQFNYSVDYTYRQEEEMLDRYEFINRYKDCMVRTEENGAYLDAFYVFYDYVSEYINNGDFSNPELVDNAITKLEMMCNTLEHFSGLEFENHMSAYPVENEEGYTR